MAAYGLMLAVRTGIPLTQRSTQRSFITGRLRLLKIAVQLNATGSRAVS
jgi:hypothetical protein